MKSSVSGFRYKFDESDKDSINLEFVIKESNTKVHVTVSKLSESYTYCKVHTDLQQYEGRVSYGMISRFINGIVRETWELINE